MQASSDPELEPIEAPDAVAQQPTADDGVLHIPRRWLYSALLPLAFVSGLAAGYLAWGRAQPEPAATIAEAQAGGASNPSRMTVDVDDDPSLGPEAAPITIVEFSDFNCPFCQRFHQDTFTALLEAYPDQIRFVYRDYPITSQESFFAAQAAECAADQGEYWEYHNALFSGRLELGMPAYRQYATEVGLDADVLQQCVESGAFAEEVQTDARYAASLGVTGTPTFFINGIPLVGAQPLASFTELIDSELN